MAMSFGSSGYITGHNILKTFKSTQTKARERHAILGSLPHWGHVHFPFSGGKLHAARRVTEVMA